MAKLDRQDFFPSNIFTGTYKFYLTIKRNNCLLKSVD